jgi:hypothetical protein
MFYEQTARSRGEFAGSTRMRRAPAIAHLPKHLEYDGAGLMESVERLEVMKRIVATRSLFGLLFRLDINSLLLIQSCFTASPEPRATS